MGYRSGEDWWRDKSSADADSYCTGIRRSIRHCLQKNIWYLDDLRIDSDVGEHEYGATQGC